jgi:dihydropteroate synthase
VSVSADAEWARLAPVLAELATWSVPVSVDTRRPSVMGRAIAAGAAIINDVAGFRSADAVSAVAGCPVGLVVMHMQGEPGTMQADPAYRDVVTEVAGFLDDRCQVLRAAGVSADRLVVDPGFGFGKTLAHNLALAGSLGRFSQLAPVLVGLSRKSMLGALTGRPVDQRLGASIAAALASVAAGARIVRVHDVAETISALTIWQAFQDAAS